ncbi:MAG: tRNA adenosine(34) deaminase TadA [Moraxellaceae bacterium]|nr:MAG: tRNA adenosine(34) deaminase TadA [Moraxellaceae bacterium]
MSQIEMDQRWMEYALQLAERAADEDEVPVGAVVVCDDQVVGEGWNQPIGQCDPSAHAEIQAIRSASKHRQNYRLTGSTLYVTIEPCIMCAGAIIHARISRVVFGASESKAGALTSQLKLLEQPFINHHPEVLGGVMAQACSARMSRFFKLKRQRAKNKRD